MVSFSGIQGKQTSKIGQINQSLKVPACFLSLQWDREGVSSNVGIYSIDI